MATRMIRRRAITDDGRRTTEYGPMPFVLCPLSSVLCPLSSVLGPFLATIHHNATPTAAVMNAACQTPHILFPTIAWACGPHPCVEKLLISAARPVSSNTPQSARIAAAANVPHTNTFVHRGALDGPGTLGVFFAIALLGRTVMIRSRCRDTLEDS